MVGSQPALKSLLKFDLFLLWLFWYAVFDEEFIFDILYKSYGVVGKSYATIKFLSVADPDG